MTVSPIPSLGPTRVAAGDVFHFYASRIAYGYPPVTAIYADDEGVLYQGEYGRKWSSWGPAYDITFVSRAFPVEAGDVGWRPIETAPKDGTEFQAYRPDQGVFVCRFMWLGDFVDDNDPAPYDEGFAGWFHDRWGWLENELTPTLWQPLAASPPLAEGQGQ